MKNEPIAAQKVVEEYINRRYKYYKKEVYVKHLQRLAFKMLQIAGKDIDYGNIEDYREMIDEIIIMVAKECPALVDVQNHRNWINCNYESVSGIPPFA